VEPQKGFGTLLPNETAALTIRWSPSFVGPVDAHLTVRTLLVDKTYTVPYKAVRGPELCTTQYTL
jgi:hypothetical protein